MADRTVSGGDGETANKMGILISTGPFAFGRKQGSLSLGWITFARVPSAIQEQLDRSLAENKVLQEELKRTADEHAHALELAHEQVESQKIEATRALKERDERIGVLTQENEGLKGQLGTVTSRTEQQLNSMGRASEDLKRQLAGAKDEIERLKALMERVSAGVR